MVSSSQSIHTDGNDVTVSTEWLNRENKRVRLLIIKTEDHEVAFFMNEDCKILLDIGRD
tara:strand:- start:811 stop:987 length:177 start_codon:yes stop_codon:yes gene_type:complete